MLILGIESSCDETAGAICSNGKILSNVTKKLNYLVIGEKPTTKKIKEAKELKVKVIIQSEWQKLLN